MAGAWERFWFASVPASTLAIVRIAFGLVVLAWGLALARDLAALFGPDALVEGQRAYLAVYVALLAAAGCMVVGYRTRIASAVVFCALLWFDHANPWAQNSGDAVLRHLSFVLMLSPCGAALSLDRRRLQQPRDRFPQVSAWSLRLLQLQVSAIYLAAAAAKLRGDAWRDGDAVALALGVPQAARFPAPDLLTTSPAAAHLLTWGTIALEVAIAILVWNRRMRPWVLAAGACFHLAIDYSLRTGFFSWAMLACYLAFLAPDTATRMIERATQRLRSLREHCRPPLRADGSSRLNRGRSPAQRGAAPPSPKSAPSAKACLARSDRDASAPAHDGVRA